MGAAVNRKKIAIRVEDARGFDSSARALPFDIKGLDG